MKNRKKFAAIVLVINRIDNMNMAPKSSAVLNPNANPINVNVSNPSDPIVLMDGDWNLQPNVPAMTQTIVNAVGTSAAAVTAYFLNEGTGGYNTTPTNNGSGASSVTKTYGDGWTGNGYNNLAKLYSSQNGIKCFGFTLAYTVTSGGAQDPSGLTTANPTWLMVNLVGANQVPKGFVLGAGSRNTQYLSGTMTVKGIFYLSSLNQMSYAVPVGDTSILTVLTQPF